MKCKMTNTTSFTLSCGSGQYLIQIIGRNRFLNELLACFLENESTMECQRLSGHGPDGGNHSAAMPRVWLQLVDGTDVESMGEWDETNCVEGGLGQQWQKALFNVEPGAGVEAEALQKGLRGLFYRSDSLEMICKGIKKMMNGDIWFSRESLLQCIMQQGAPEAAKGRPADQAGGAAAQGRAQLTIREKSILLRLRQGASNQEIADEMVVSIHTVKSHLYNLYRKINVPNRFQATLWAASNLD